MMRIRSRRACLLEAALMLLFVDAAWTSVPKGGCHASGAILADGDRTTGFYERPAIPAGHAKGSAPLFLLAKDVAPGSTASEESTPQQEVPAVDPDNDATPPQPEPQPADPPEQQGQPPVERGQGSEPEPAPQPSQQ